MSSQTATNTSPRVKVFRGDDDSMVDQLIAACQEHKQGPVTPMPGFGRELKPYFAEGEFVPPPRMVKRKASPKSSRDVSPNLASPVLGDQTKSALHSHAHHESNSKKKSHAGNIDNNNITSDSPSCPGIFSSPSPRELPTPSLKLLKCASGPTSQMDGVPRPGYPFMKLPTIWVRAR